MNNNKSKKYVDSIKNFFTFGKLYSLELNFLFSSNYFTSNIKFTLETVETVEIVESVNRPLEVYEKRKTCCLYFELDSHSRLFF